MYSAVCFYYDGENREMIMAGKKAPLKKKMPADKTPAKKPTFKKGMPDGLKPGKGKRSC
jgi:hypothetical protein